MKQDHLKFFLFFFVFFLQTNALFSGYFSSKDPISGVMLRELQAQSIRQKLPDTPIDKPIAAHLHTREVYCYTPKFIAGESYISLDKCSYSSALPARYDVFQRVAWKVRHVWLCMTAPGSVTGIDGNGKTQWDYVKLRPCVLNDANQRWILKDDAFHTADGEFRVKDYKWYIYISQNSGDYYDHKLEKYSMEEWKSTIAAPGNISLKLSIGWKHITNNGFRMYYLSDNGGSSTEPFDYYYNPENGHLASYATGSGKLACLVSILPTSKSENWDWVRWKFCNDKVPQDQNQKDLGYWDISFLDGREGPLIDRNGNFLRVTRYSIDWGAPYTVKPDYLKSDTQYSPTSQFVLSYDMERWNRYVYGNLGDMLTYCPAPGQKLTDAKTRVKRTLPPDFRLTREWIERLYAISTSGSADRTIVGVGVCGPCLLHSFQIIAELQAYYPGRPLTRGGYFFNTGQGRNPIDSLRQRYPLLYGAIHDIPRGNLVPLYPGESDDMVAIRLAAATTRAVLPRFDWRLSDLAVGRDAIISSIQQLLNAPAGTIWIGFIAYITSNGDLLRHAVPMLRSHSGIQIIPTNTRMSLATFTERISGETDPNTIMSRFIRSRSATITSFAALQLTGEVTNPLSVVMSQRNCTGEGDERRGNREPPRSSTVNQCLSGRCSIQ
ncbi:DUF1561 family protein [Bartonella sp. A05]|uniref:DUF1561 family protein n=1 Tax=Bartonella sp. A05 TaxID=2967261 RepID=UPI0022A91F70|nr:DUF1561 family protein [Bartonella sp. A05]MCZ2204491.1 DUF1561 domain-containing protein [Bartonella sp. A05]